MNNLLQKATQILEHGGVVVYPTDTAYGLGVDATNENAIEKIFDLKGRGQEKAVHITVADIEMAELYAEITEDAKKLAEAFLPGPLTLVVKRKKTLPDMLALGKETIGIRMPKNATALALVKAFGKPITATSANISGDDTSYTIDAVRDSFGLRAGEIDLYVDEGQLPHIIPSTLVDITGAKSVILREGPVSREEVESVLG
jgi:L-threonylcarbamoyladenylate synthase